MTSGRRPSRIARAWRRVADHRREAAAVSGFMVLMAVGAAATGVSSWLGENAGRDGFVAAVVVAFSTVWLPIAVIDFRRCTRETALRAKVEEDLDRQTSAAQACARELTVTRDRVDRVLDGGGPRIVWQPIVAVASGAAVGYEALSRFDDATPPDVWFADAARVGLGVDLELAAIANAVQAMDRLPDDAYLSINASPDALQDPRLGALVTRADPGRVVVELTEHLAFEDYTSLRVAIAQLHAIGARVAVDDAGAGYASLRHIVDLSPDLIKIDRSLVRKLHAHPARRSLVAALVGFADDVGATLVAEGVEHPDEAAALQRWGVRYAQGWLYGRPEPEPKRLPCLERSA